MHRGRTLSAHGSIDAHYALTQEDAFYTPAHFDHLLEVRRDVVGVGVVPGGLQPGHVRRYLRLMAPRGFALQPADLVVHRALGLVGRALPLGRSFSVAGAARRHGIPLERVPKVNASSFVNSLRARAEGGVRAIKTTPLMTVEESLDALKRADAASDYTASHPFPSAGLPVPRSKPVDCKGSSRPTCGSSSSARERW